MLFVQWEISAKIVALAISAQLIESQSTNTSIVRCKCARQSFGAATLALLSV